jgi:hypothetical protein
VVGLFGDYCDDSPNLRARLDWQGYQRFNVSPSSPLGSQGMCAVVIDYNRLSLLQRQPGQPFPKTNNWLGWRFYITWIDRRHIVEAVIFFIY